MSESDLAWPIASIERVNYSNGEPVSISYILSFKNKTPHKGIIYLDKTKIYTHMFQIWHDLSFNESHHRYEFPDPNVLNDSPYHIYDEVINLVDSFIIEHFLMEKKL
jgi:hypothetical protein